MERKWFHGKWIWEMNYYIHGKSTFLRHLSTERWRFPSICPIFVLSISILLNGPFKKVPIEWPERTCLHLWLNYGHSVATFNEFTIFWDKNGLKSLFIVHFWGHRNTESPWRFSQIIWLPSFERFSVKFYIYAISLKKIHLDFSRADNKIKFNDLCINEHIWVFEEDAVKAPLPWCFFSYKIGISFLSVEGEGKKVCLGGLSYQPFNTKL